MKRSKHSLSNYKLLSMNMGELVPIGLIEVLPGDTMQLATSALVRMSPLATPVMHPVHVSVHHWFVAHRLVWDNWEDFITGGPSNDDPNTFPTITFGSNISNGDLADYLGIPTGGKPTVSALPFRGYSKIFNEFYRDQDLDTELTIDTSDGADTTTNTTLQHVRWEKDMFTAARPWTQKGNEVTMPLSGDAPIKGIGKINQDFASSSVSVYEPDGSNPTYDYAQALNWGAAGSDGQFYIKGDAATSGTQQLTADLSQAGGPSINELREAFGLQRFAEARAMYGSRYTEYLRYLGVKSSDARLQRPEYLGGGKQTVQFSEVLQTGVDSSDSGVGTLKGHGIGALRSNRIRRFFEEHGYIYSFMSIKPKTIYADGIPATFLRTTKEEFFQKELQHIGQEEIQNQEVYFAHSSPTGTFGYRNRYDSYRRQPSQIAGDFRGNLNSWHFARIFGSDPTLNSDFVKCTPAESRVFQSTANDTVYVMANNSIQARRLVSKLGTPSGL